MPRTKRPSKTQIISDFTDAAANFIVRNPPEGFGVAYFHICVMSGRIEDATKYMQEFMDKKAKEAEHGSESSGV